MDYHNMMDNITTDRLTRISEVIMANGHQNISSIGSHEVPFTQKGTTEYYVEYIIGSIMTVMVLIGCTANLSVIILFSTNKGIMTRTTFLLRALAISDGIMASVGGTMFCVNSFKHTWVFGIKGCQFYATVTYWCGCTSIALLVAVGLERTLTICHTNSSLYVRKLLPAHIKVMVALSYAWGGVWAILPLIGIQSYTYEGTISCSLNWEGTAESDFVYNVVIFATVYALPLSIILVTNAVIYKFVRRMLQIRNKFRQATSNKKLDWRLARSLILATVFYLLAWTPYAIVSMKVAFFGASGTSQMQFKLLSFFAKSSFIFNPLVYIGLHPPYRRAMLDMWNRSQESNPSQTKVETLYLRTRGGATFSPSSGDNYMSTIQNITALDGGRRASHSMGDADNAICRIVDTRVHTGTRLISPEIEEQPFSQELLNQEHCGLLCQQRETTAVVLYIQQSTACSAPNIFTASSSSSW